MPAAGPAGAELLAGIDGVNSRPVRKIMLIEAQFGAVKRFSAVRSPLRHLLDLPLVAERSRRCLR
jgi:hypothetical protein